VKKKKELSKKIVVKKRFVAKHLLETFEKIKMGEEREIIVTWSRASTIIPSMVGHTIIMGFYPVRFLKKIQNSDIFFI
jgi:ribosomal protein S19